MTDPSAVRLPVVPERAATGRTAALYAEIRDHFGLGFVPDVFHLASTRTSFMSVFWDGYRSMFSEGVLDREVKELIAALVARDAGCRYCVDAHTFFLELIGAGSRVAAAARTEPVDEMPVTDEVRQLLRLVQRVDYEAHRITDRDFDQLRRAGWSDDALIEAVWTACLFNCIVRLADTFGLYRVGQLTEVAG